MKTLVTILAVGLAFATFFDNAAAVCEQRHSRNTCFEALNP